MAASVLISGTSSGIGEACARLLASEGFHVYAGTRSPQDSMKWSGAYSVDPVVLDVTSPEQIRAVVRRLESAQHQLYAIVNNAGIMPTGRVESFDMADVRQVFETNLFGHWYLTQLCVPLLRASRGRIVNIGSTNGRLSGPNLAAYSASKHSLEALTETLHLELSSDGIGVTIIEPGAIRTSLWDKVIRWEAEASRQDVPSANDVARRRRLMELRDRSLPPESVARTVLRALRDKRPRYRYIVGKDAQIRVALASLLPRPALFALRRMKH